VKSAKELLLFFKQNSALEKKSRSVENLLRRNGSSHVQTATKANLKSKISKAREEVTLNLAGTLSQKAAKPSSSQQTRDRLVLNLSSLQPQEYSDQLASQQSKKKQLLSLLNQKFQKKLA